MAAGERVDQIAQFTRPHCRGDVHLVVLVVLAAPGYLWRLLSRQPLHIPVEEQPIAADGVLGWHATDGARVPT